MSKRELVLCLMILALNVATGQTKKGNSDTILIKNLPDVTVVGRNSKSNYQQMPEIVAQIFMRVKRIH